MDEAHGLFMVSEGSMAKKNRETRGPAGLSYWTGIQRGRAGRWEWFCPQVLGGEEEPLGSGWRGEQDALTGTQAWRLSALPP